MGRQYLREYALTIGNGTEALEIKELRIAFEITKDILGFPNLARIDIYNLNDTSRGKVKDEFTKITFNVGYQNGVKQIFLGDIRNVVHARQGVDFITTIYAADGDRDFRESFTNVTFSEGATVKQIVQEVSKSFSEVTTGILDGLESTKDKLLGTTLSGDSSTILNQLGEDYDFDWSIQDNRLETINKDEAFDDVTVVSSQTGMIGSPSITELGADVKMLLNPRILPNRQIQIQSATPEYELGNLFFRGIKRTLGEGFYKVQKVVHTGDTESNDFFTTVTGRGR